MGVPNYRTRRRRTGHDWLYDGKSRIPQRENASDCSVFSCMNAEFICRNRPIEFWQQNMNYFRMNKIYEFVLDQPLNWIIVWNDFTTHFWFKFLLTSNYTDFVFLLLLFITRIVHKEIRHFLWIYYGFNISYYPYYFYCVQKNTINLALRLPWLKCCFLFHWLNVFMYMYVRSFLCLHPIRPDVREACCI